MSQSRFFSAALLFLGLVSLSACERGSQGEVAAADPERLIPKPCWFQSDDNWPDAQCFMMEVPENYAKPAGRKIRFPVVRFKAVTPDPTKRPLLHLGAGGPGASMGLEPENASDWLWLNYAKMTVEDGRDLIIMDPRGSGMAEPRLNCKEFIKDANTAFQRKLTSDEEVRVFTYSMERCYNRLSQIADLAEYNSATVAHDVEALREEMGVPQFNLYGVSYASRYALTVARDYPNAVRALVLNSAVFPNITYTQHLADDTVAAFKRGFEYCRDDKQCHEQYPHLQSRLESLVQALDDNPRTITVKHHFSEQEYPFVLTGQRLLRVLFQSLYNEQFYPDLPRVIAALESDDSDAEAMAPVKKAVAKFMDIVLDPYFGDAAGVSHYCYEEAPFVDFDKARAKADDTGVLGGAVRTDLELMQVQCRIWAIPGASMLESQPVHTSLPVLLLHGGLDPILAAADVDKARHELPNHQWLLFPHLAHDVISASNCAENAAARFLDHPEEPQRDSALACRQRELAQQSGDADTTPPPSSPQPATAPAP
ncbi:alpha/beta hydrolase [Microbulbifer sp. SAOS-129_SWC]|uniref:alpha/beta hydrolase n=1 Tax=Microbulbifer sp. SAOS-129_SWC TaxID=3145235 RepID=UPI003217B679